MKKIIVSILIVIVIIAGILLEPGMSRQQLSNIADFSMDSQGNVYSISCDDDQSYKLNKIDSKGTITYQYDLEGTDSDSEYRQLILDQDSNIYILFNKTDSSSKKVTEKVVMYNSSGVYLREILNVDTDISSKDKSIVPYIYKIQTVGESLKVICRVQDTYKIMTINPKNTNNITTEQTFSTISYRDVKNEVSMVGNMSVTSSGKVVYSTLRGGLFIRDTSGNEIDLTQKIGDTVSLVDFSAVGNNVYFTDTITGNFYKVSADNVDVTKVYSPGDTIYQKSKLKLDDVNYIKAISDDNYSAVVKGSNDLSYVKIGTDACLIKSIMPSFFPSRLLIILCIVAVGVALIFIVTLIISKLRKRFNLILKMELMFIPVYFILIAIFLTFLLVTTSSDYRNIIENYQEMAVSTMKDYIDGDKFESVDRTTSYMNTDYESLEKSLSNGYEATKGMMDFANLYYITYVVDNNKIYLASNNEYNKSNSYGKYYMESNIRESSQAYSPLDYVMDSGTVISYYDMLKELAENEFVSHDYTNNYGDWIGVLSAIRNSDGKIVGIVECRVDKQVSQTNLASNTIVGIVCGVLLFVILCAVYMFYVLKFALSPMKELTSALTKISRGNFNAKANVKSKDEFADIGQTINLMAASITNNVHTLVELNKSYTKFVPKELFRLLGKKNVVDVNIYDRNLQKINILHLTINVSYQEVFGKISEDEYFDIMNDTFKVLIDVVQRNNGVIQSFDGLGMTALFPESAEQAVQASLQFKESPIRKEIKERMNVVIGSGDTLVGVFGNETRATVTTSSDEILKINHISNNIEKVGINHAILKSAVDSVNNMSKYKYRFVGIVKSNTSDNDTYLYQLFDNEEPQVKTMYRLTQKLFEKAVNLYISNNLLEARKTFADILKINEDDSVAMYYLYLCDNNIGKTYDQWHGYIFE